MPTVFSRIIEGERSGRFVWRDDFCAAFLTIAPTAPGHTLVVPREEIDHWIDLPPDLAAHLWAVSQLIGKAQQEAFSPRKVGLLVVGEEVPHAHVHLIPFRSLAEMDLANADPSADPAGLDAAAERLRRALRTAGHPEVDA